MAIFVLTCRRCGIKLIGRSTVSERDAFICPECRKLIAKPSTLRQTIFRVLAGILAPLCLLAVIWQKPPLRTAIGELLVAIAFAVFAVFGTSAADSVLSAFFGIKSNTSKTHEKSGSQDNADHD